MIKEYESGVSLVDLGKRFGMAPISARRLLAENGVALRRSGHFCTHLGPDQLKAAMAAYDAGATVTDLAERLGCSTLTVRRRLLDSGFTFRPRGSRRHVDDGTERALAELTPAERPHRGAAPRDDPPPPRESPEPDLASIAHAYIVERRSLDWLASRYEIPAARIRETLRSGGVAIRPAGHGG